MEADVERQQEARLVNIFLGQGADRDPERTEQEKVAERGVLSSLRVKRILTEEKDYVTFPHLPAVMESPYHL